MARTHLVQVAGGQALAGADLAEDDHGQVGGGDFGQLVLDPRQRRAAADERLSGPLGRRSV